MTGAFEFQGVLRSEDLDSTITDPVTAILARTAPTDQSSADGPPIRLRGPTRSRRRPVLLSVSWKFGAC